MLTRTNRGILQAIVKWYDMKKKWPSNIDVAQILNVNELTVERAYNALVSRGYLIKTKYGRYRLSNLKENSLDVLQCICETMAYKGYCPSDEELSKMLNLSEKMINYHLKALVKAEYIRIGNDEHGRYFEIRRFR